MNAWRIEREGYEPEDTDNGSRFFIGNGFMGVRGALEECRCNYQPAINLAGIYDLAEGRLWREPVNAPNGFYVELENPGSVITHRQTLNIRHGIFTRDTHYERVRLHIERFASMDNPHLLCQRITVEPTASEITLICGIDGEVWDLNGPHLTDIKINSGDVLSVSALTFEKRIPITVCETCDKMHDKIRTHNNSVYRIFKITCPFTIERMITVNAPPVKSAYDACLKAHASVWERLWSGSEVRIYGDESAQLAINYSLYHLHSIAPRHAQGLSIPARGLSGQTYKGAVFWDTEIFLMPFFTLTEPELARKLINYRIDTLEGARMKAAEYGFNGAFFAWESQEGGIEGCTDFSVTDVFTGRPVRTYFRDKQIHISGDIVYALSRYADLTGDQSLLSSGSQLLKACGEFYISRAYCRPGSEILEFTDVVGPDEYHERVDNNAFTNHMALFALSKAGFNYKVREPRVKNGIIEQFDGYFHLECVSLGEVRARIRHPREYWGTQNGVAFPTQIIKQADVIAMMSLFPEDFSSEAVRRNWEYYEPRTEHGSSLSACMYALAACRFGRSDWAYPLFLKSARADLDGGGKSWAGDIYIGGTHPAAAGGAYMIITQGFASLKLEGESLNVSPRLPESISGLEFPIIFRGKRMLVRVNRESVNITER